MSNNDRVFLQAYNLWLGPWKMSYEARKPMPNMSQHIKQFMNRNAEEKGHNQDHSIEKELWKIHTGIKNGSCIITYSSRTVAYSYAVTYIHIQLHSHTQQFTICQELLMFSSSSPLLAPKQWVLRDWKLKLNLYTLCIWDIQMDLNCNRPNNILAVIIYGAVGALRCWKLLLCLDCFPVHYIVCIASVSHCIIARNINPVCIR